MEKIVITSEEKPSKTITSLIEDFLSTFTPLEISHGGKCLLFFDKRSKAYYCSCHLQAHDFCEVADFDATIETNEDDDLYKLNRDITENESAFNIMVHDAQAGRTFEDIVVEYDKSYNDQYPLKIYGGQHRVKAIQKAKDTSSNIFHGLRIYFGLSKEQKVEIATINNTSIAVSNDLLDRMREQLLGSELRDFCQTVGLLGNQQDFSDRKDLIIPTVRIARTFVVNYWKGRRAKRGEYNIPTVCKSGGKDEEYLSIRNVIDWEDSDFIEAGKKFATLHQTQRQKVSTRKSDNNAQLASKTLSLTVVASWSFAAGIYLDNRSQLDILYNITNNLGASEDPLNAKALTEARMKGIDTDTYRGLGTRTTPEELGRMLEVFIVLIEKATEKKITKALANAAIQSFEAKKAVQTATKSLAKI